MNLGICYQGSKSKLAEHIIALLPRAEHFYDLFAGGCAISHCALLSGKWKHVHISDINDSVILFRDALEGNIPDGSEWISREDFYLRKDTDPYVRLVWSFASNQRDYIYSREIEPYKKAVHEMIYAPTPNERRLKFKEVCRLMEEMYIIGSKENTPPRIRTYNTTQIARDCITSAINGADITPPIIGYSANYNQQSECVVSRKRPTEQQMQGGSYNATLFTRGV